MKIIAKSTAGGQAITLTAAFTTDHPASSYGRPVMYECYVTEAAEEEAAAFMLSDEA